MSSDHDNKLFGQMNDEYMSWEEELNYTEEYLTDFEDDEEVESSSKEDENLVPDNKDISNNYEAGTSFLPDTFELQERFDNLILYFYNETKNKNYFPLFLLTLLILILNYYFLLFIFFLFGYLVSVYDIKHLSSHLCSSATSHSAVTASQTSDVTLAVKDDKDISNEWKLFIDLIIKELNYSDEINKNLRRSLSKIVKNLYCYDYELNILSIGLILLDYVKGNYKKESSPSSQKEVHLKLEKLFYFLLSKTVAKNDSSELLKSFVVDLLMPYLIHLLDTISQPRFIYYLFSELSKQQSTMSSSSSLDSQLDSVLEQQNPQENSGEGLIYNSFGLFMEYMEINNYPNYLRFLNNVDIYRQFAVIEKDFMKQDAISIFDMHFGAAATNPIPLDDLRTNKLKNDIESSCNVDVFKSVQEYILGVLETEYLEGFKAWKENREKEDGSTDSLKSNEAFKNALNNVNSSPVKQNNVDMRSKSSSSEKHPLDNPNHLKTLSVSNTLDTKSLAQQNHSKAVKHLAEAIIQLREQLMHIDSTITTLKSTTTLNINKQIAIQKKLKKLQAEKKQITRQVEIYMEQADEVIDHDFSDLSFSKVRVFDVEEKDVFLVEFNDIVLRRKFKEFEVLDKRLKQQFDKCKKISFPCLEPNKGKGAKNKIGIDLSSGSSNTVNRSFRSLVGELDSYLQIVMSDQLICESIPVYLFFYEKNVVFKLKKEKVKQDSGMIVDVLFGILTELFDLRNQWLRRKSLSVLRQIVLRQQGRFDKVFDESFSAVVEYWKKNDFVMWIVESFWPEPERKFTVKEYDGEIGNEGVFVIMDNKYLQMVVGKYNSVVGAQRLAELVQDVDMNKVLIVNLLEVILKDVFKKDKRCC